MGTEERGRSNRPGREIRRHVALKTEKQQVKKEYEQGRSVVQSQKSINAHREQSNFDFNGSASCHLGELTKIDRASFAGRLGHLHRSSQLASHVCAGQRPTSD
jgi:hypothetical protein